MTNTNKVVTNQNKFNLNTPPEIKNFERSPEQYLYSQYNV